MYICFLNVCLQIKLKDAKELIRSRNSKSMCCEWAIDLTENTMAKGKRTNAKQWLKKKKKQKKNPQWTEKPRYSS